MNESILKKANSVTNGVYESLKGLAKIVDHTNSSVISYQRSMISLIDPP